jgi:uridine phosphorylase
LETITVVAYGDFRGRRWPQMMMVLNNDTRESWRRTTMGKEQDQVANKDGIWHLVVAVIPK